MQRSDFGHGMPPMVRAEYAEALRKDAERYRRLRDGQNWPAVFGGHDEPEPLRGAHLDAAIDAKLALHNAQVTGASPALMAKRPR